MENVTFLGDNFSKALRDLLCSRTVEVSWAKRLLEEQILPAGWNIHEMHRRHSRQFALPYYDYFITVEDKDESVVDELLALTLTRIVDLATTPEGITSLLFFTRAIDWPGNTINELQQKIIAQLPSEDIRELLDVLIEFFNRHYRINVHSPEDLSSFEKFEDLHFRLQYKEPFERSIGLLRSLLRMRPADLPFLKIIAKLAPDPKVAFFEYPIELPINDNTFLNFLREHPSEIAFWGFLLSKTSIYNSPVYPRTVYQFFINDYWDLVGWHVFRKIYGQGKRVRSDEPAQSMLLSVLNEFVAPQFFRPVVRNQVLNCVTRFGNDMTTICNWLYHYAGDGTIPTFNDATIEALGNLLIHQLQYIKDKLVDFVSNRSLIYKAWLTDMSQPSTQVALTILHDSVIDMTDMQWQRLKSIHRNLCNELRVYFYGSFTPQHVTREICNHLAALWMSFPRHLDTPEPERVQRIDKVLQVFSETVGSHWVLLSEREELFWDTEAAQSTNANAELIYTIDRFRNVPPAYQEVVANFRERILRKATVHWDI